MLEQEAAPAVPDDMRLVLMVRNAVVALNQANITGNYSVLREMGTANFQMTNSPARLAEIFATLRAHKIDMTPVMVFNPKFTTGPALDGQVLHVAGFFPTTPEQVQFDLAYQHMGEQWLLAGISISVTPAIEGAQASAAPAGQLLQASAEPPSSGAKPIRIDLNLPSSAQTGAGAPKKPAAVKKPKPAAPAQKAAASQTAAPVEAPPPPPATQQQPAPAETSSGSGPAWNPFGR